MSMLLRKRLCCAGVQASKGVSEKLNALGMMGLLDGNPPLHAHWLALGLRWACVGLAASG
jgi:hypothetical protein